MLRIKELLNEILQAIFNLATVQFSEQLANATVLSRIAGSAHGLKLPNGRYIVFFSYGITTTQARTSLPVIRIIDSDKYVLRSVNPYFLPCLVDSTMNISYSNTDGYWWTAPGSWAANTTFRISGTCLMEKTNIQVS